MNVRVDIDCGGWWPPGGGEPGTEWVYEGAPLVLLFDGDDIDVLMPTPDGDRAIASFPATALAALFVATTSTPEAKP